MKILGLDFSIKKVPKKRDKLKIAASYEGHDFYIMDATPEYCNLRFFYFLSKTEQINTLVLPNEYFLAVCDQFEVMNEKQFSQHKGTLIDNVRYFISRRDMAWYHTSIAVIEAFVLVDDEPIDELSIKHNKIKRDIFIKNPDARFFFMNLCAQYLKSLKTDFQDIDPEGLMKMMAGLNLEPELLESIMSHLTSEHFGTLISKPAAK